MRTNRRRIAVALAMTGAILACAGMLGCSLGAKWLTQPDRKPVGAAPPGLHAQEVDITSASGSTQRGWFIQGRPSASAILQLHDTQCGRSA